MVIVRFTKDAMHVEGHAKRGLKGVMVCASASVLLQGLAGIAKVTKGVNGIVEDDGHIVVPFSWQYKAELLFVVYCLRCLARTSPSNIRIVKVPSWLKHKRPLPHL